MLMLAVAVTMAMALVEFTVLVLAVAVAVASAVAVAPSAALFMTGHVETLEQNIHVDAPTGVLAGIVDMGLSVVESVALISVASSVGMVW